MSKIGPTVMVELWKGIIVRLDSGCRHGSVYNSGRLQELSDVLLPACYRRGGQVGSYQMFACATNVALSDLKPAPPTFPIFQYIT